MWLHVGGIIFKYDGVYRDFFFIDLQAKKYEKNPSTWGQGHGQEVYLCETNAMLSFNASSKMRQRRHTLSSQISHIL